MNGRSQGPPRIRDPCDLPVPVFSRIMAALPLRERLECRVRGAGARPGAPG